MSETVITVQGSFESLSPAERAVVTVHVGFEGPDREPVLTRTTQGTAALVAGLRLRRTDDGPVTWWASDRLRVWSRRPYHNQGAQLPLVHHARTTTRARFRDADALAQWVEAASRFPGVAVESVTWDLTAPTRDAALAAARTRAVEEARAKAAAYAAALGLTELRCTAVADPGMLGDHSSAQGGGPVAFARAAATSGGEEPGGLSFQPEDIAVSATVDARFTAS